MDRNTMSHFGAAPRAEISRSKFPLSHTITFDGNAGDLIPFDFWEVLPGDTFSVETNKVIRLTTPIYPIMGNIYLDVYWFYAPSRILWDHWKAFCGESNKAWLPSVQYSIPQVAIETAGAGFPKHSIADYLGCPTAESMPDSSIGALSINALPFRMYSQVVNEWFRDQNLQDPIYSPTGDSVESGFTSQEVAYTPTSYARGGMPWRAAKFHDLFTSCLPAPQKGNDVLIPGGYVNLTAPVVTSSDNHVNLGPAVNWTSNSDGTTYYSVVRGGSNGEPMTRNVSGASQGIKPLNLVVDANGGEDVNSVTLGTINQLRNAFQIQKLLEADARGGTRYRELLKYHFGVTSPDASQQIPEYLGGNRIPINIHQVVNQAQAPDVAGTDNMFLGDTGAMSVTSDSHYDFEKSFTEHGYIMGFAVLRYDHSYSQGLHKVWSKKNRFDFYYPELANIGEQAVHTYEIDCQYGNNNADGESNPNADRIFGYQEAWYDYRYIPDRVSGNFRPGIRNSLAVWHLSDYYEEQPTLSSDWIQEDLNNLDRVLYFAHNNASQFFADFYVRCEATRPMPVYSIPGLADHH